MFIKCENYTDSTTCNIFSNQCVWLLSSGGNSGSCLFNSSLTCESYNNDTQCISDNDRNCFWDGTDVTDESESDEGEEVDKTDEIDETNE
jgi:hypothetical protein